MSNLSEMAYNKSNEHGESTRLDELWKYDILDSIIEKEYEDITFLASLICDVPVSLISFVDKDRQWFKSHKGLSISESSLENSFCKYSLSMDEEFLIIPDARKDVRFYDNPFVVGNPNIVFYVGIPLINESGFCLGSLCVIDTKPRELLKEQFAALKIMASQVMNLLEMRKSNLGLEAIRLKLEIHHSELEQSTRKLRESEAQLRGMYEGMNVMLAVSDPNNNPIYFTEAWAILTGKTMEELLDIGWPNLIHPEDRDKVITDYLSAFEKREQYLCEYRIVNNLGNDTWLLTQCSPQILYDGTFIGYTGSSADITGLNEVGQELLLVAKRLQLALEVGKLGSYEYDSKFGKIKGSAQFKETCGVNNELDVLQLQRIILPQYLPTIKNAVNNSIKNNMVYHVKLQIKQHDGPIKWIQVSGWPIYDNVGKPIKIMGITIDITEQKVFESLLERQVAERTKELEEKNILLYKMNRELESFAYISSHDLQEPLRKIQTFSLLILDNEATSLSDRAKNYFLRIQQSANRLQILINDLLAYSSTAFSEKVFIKTDLNQIIDEVREDLREEIEQKHATIEVSTLCEVEIIPFQFRQLLQNLISNSLKYSFAGRPPNIKIKGYVALGNELNNDHLKSAIKYCHISVADNGIGFEPDNKEKIFGLFQRLHTRNEYHGTGIGLAIVKKIAENHNGFITAKSELNAGAIFDVYIPLVFSQSAKIQESEINKLLLNNN